MSTRLDARVIYENPMTALRTVELSYAAEIAVTAWLESQGRDIWQTARSIRRNKKGRVTFKCGVGYAVVDNDLLGGNGDGRTERRFNDDSDSYIYAR